MSMGDLPRLPDEYIPRVEKLVDLVKSGDADIAEIIGKLMGPVIGKMLPVIMGSGGDKLMAIMPAVMGMLPALIGKQIYLGVIDVGYYRVKVGMLPRLINFKESTVEEVKAAKLPTVVVDLDLIPLLFQGLPGIISLMTDGKLTIYGVEVLVGWFRAVSKNTGIVDTALPAVRLMTKEVLQEIQEPFTEAADEMLSAYGV
jgi:hypothetical protein